MVLNLNELPMKYWSMKTIMSYIQRRIIVYSIMYYELNGSCITDKDYDELSHQLVELMNSNSKSVCEQTTYWYAMYDFDGSTGFDIPSRLTKHDLEYLTSIASHVYKQWKDSTTEQERREKINAQVKGFRK